eukprot:c15899_g1_i2.p1 GENE.c15899_g1_i2~~c15899_g1_i2.p1  ORF type:complete len:186 (-),score=33.22 c15899_g1_i2:24-581(-)
MNRAVCLVAVALLGCAGLQIQAIFDLIAVDDVRGLKIALESEGGAKLLNERGSGGQTPLMNACLKGKLQAVKYLLSRGADWTIGEQDGYTPMHGAGFQGRAEVAKVLIAAGLDPNDMHSDGFTPLHRACWGGETRHTQTVQAFLDAGVSPLTPTRDGRKPIELTKNVGTKKILMAAIDQLVKKEL